MISKPNKYQVEFNRVRMAVGLDPILDQKTYKELVTRYYRNIENFKQLLHVGLITNQLRYEILAKQGKYAIPPFHSITNTALNVADEFFKDLNARRLDPKQRKKEISKTKNKNLRDGINELRTLVGLPETDSPYTGIKVIDVDIWAKFVKDFNQLRKNAGLPIKQYTNENCDYFKNLGGVDVVIEKIANGKVSEIFEKELIDYEESKRLRAINQLKKLERGMYGALCAIEEINEIEEFIFVKPDDERRRALSIQISLAKSLTKAEQTKFKPGYVYVISNPAWPGQFKIGSTLDLNKRLNSFQTSSPFADFKIESYIIVEDRRVIESKAHIEFASHRGHGEWFNTSLVDLAFFTEM